MLVTLVAVLGATGILPTHSTPEAVFASTPEQAAAGSSSEAGALRLSGWVSASLPRHPDQQRVARAISTKLPGHAGDGKRIVFDVSDQRVWLVSARDRVRRTYLVSGSLTDNLDAGSYEVYSKSLDAIGVDDSGTMKYMVRFAHGPRAAIGFHDIPVFQGEKLQTADQLGTPQSHGCIRQLRSDATALWDFAPIGTTVIVLD